MVDFLLIILLIATPLAFGTVHTPAIIIFSIFTVVIFNLCFLNSTDNLKALIKLPIVRWSILFTGLIIFQLIPLPKNILKIISPATFKLYSDYSLTYTATNAWRTLSIYPWATISELIKLISYGLIFLVVLGRIKSTPQDSRHALPTRFLLLGALTGILSILFHSLYDFNLHISANAFYFVVILGILAGVTQYRDTGFNHRFVQRIADSIIFIGFCIALFAIVQRFGAPGKIYWVMQMGDGGSFGTYVNYDHYAGFMELCAPLAIAAFLGSIAQSSFFRQENLRKKILWFSSSEANKTLLYLFLSVVMAGSLFLSKSRGGIMSFILSMLILFWVVIAKTRKKPKNRLIISIIVTILLIAAMITWLGPEPILKRFHLLFNKGFFKMEGPIGIRISFYKDTLNIISDFPVLGTGFGTFSNAFPPYRSFIYYNKFLRYTHNDYLQLLSEMGLFGGIFIMLFLAFFIRRYFWVLKRLK